jgi:hypothetical protein
MERPSSATVRPMGRPIDTSIEARARQLEAYRAMRPADRLRLADQMSAEVRSLARSGIRARLGGDSSEEDVDAALARILLGADGAAALRARHPAGRR